MPRRHVADLPVDMNDRVGTVVRADTAIKKFINSGRSTGQFGEAL